MSFLDILNKIMGYIVGFSAMMITSGTVLCMTQKKREHFLWRIIPCVLGFWIIFMVFPGESWWMRILKFGSFSNYYTVVFIVLIFVLWFCFDVSWQGAVFYSVSAYLAQYSSSTMWRLIGDFFNINFSIADLFDKTIYLVTFLSILAIVFFIYKYFIKPRQEMKIKNTVMVFFAGLALLVTAYSRQVTNSILRPISDSSEFSFVAYNMNTYIYAASLFVCILLFALLLTTIEMRRAKDEAEEIERMLTLQGNYQKLSQDNMEIINMKCHDLKKQINYIRHIENETEKDDLLKETEQAVMIYDRIAHTGNKMLDVLLTEKALVCEKNSIKFTYIVDSKDIDVITPSDLYSLLGNAIDNAIECVMKYEECKRVISLKISNSGSGFMNILVENYCDKSPVCENGLPVSTKSDRHYHGYGLKSIRYIVGKYDGGMNLSCESDTYSLSVVLPLKKS